MLQVRWRRILPIVQLMIYFSLVWNGCWYRPTWQYWLEKWMYPASEPAGFAAEWIDGFVPLSEQVAAGLNLPAAALISLAPFEGDLRSGAAKELAIHAVTAL